jgi:hypothetical protein
MYYSRLSAISIRTSLCKCEINVGEYNRLDLVKDNTKKKTCIIEMHSSPGAI